MTGFTDAGMHDERAEPGGQGEAAIIRIARRQTALSDHRNGTGCAEAHNAERKQRNIQGLHDTPLKQLRSQS